MSIKTLSDILVEMGETPISTDINQVQILDETNFYQLTTSTPPRLNLTPKNHSSKIHKTKKCKSVNKKPTAHTIKPTPVCHNPNNTKYQPNNRQATHLPQSADKKNKDSKIFKTSTTKTLLEKVRQGSGQSLALSKLDKKLQDTAIEPLTPPDRATAYLRWLAFYYLSRRELSSYELKTKLLAKGCDPNSVAELVKEFTEKGYQSDERCAAMIVRENIRKGRGRRHIEQALKKAKITLPDHTDNELDRIIQDAHTQALTESVMLEKPSGNNEEIHWLKLAVAARTKKYGDSIPSTAKEKAKQLRFLQYRGFEMSICLEALKTTLATLQELDR